MSLQGKLAEWQAAGILPADVAARILAYEERTHRQRPYVLYALGGLGALAVATGILALVASNWDVIPAGVKLGIDVLLVAGVSAGIVRADARESAWARETLLVLQYGVVLASIGLIAQVYHLGGAPYEALLAWTALTAFLMSRGRSAVLGAIWIIGLKVTYGALLAELGDARGMEQFAGSLAYLAPLVCLGLAGAPAVVRARPQLARTLRAFGWAELALAGSLGPLGFYADWGSDERTSLLYAGFGLAAAGTAIVGARVGRGPAGAGERRAVQLALGAALLAAFVPFLLPHDEWPVAAALAFIGFWATAGWAAHRLRQFHLLNLATAMIGLRILIAYFEVFGSLLSTGLGLITGGLLTLGIAYVWLRKSRDFKRELAPEPGERAGEEGTAMRKATAIAAIVPVLGIVALIVRAEVKVRTGATWLLGIEGYDPRDLLSGHFLRYRHAFVWEGQDSCGDQPPDDGATLSWRGRRSPVPGTAAGCCVCLLRRGEGLVEPGARLVQCSEIEAQGCDGALQADDVIGPQKYFVPEDRALALEQALRGRTAAVSVSLRRGAAPAVKELYLDGKPWREALP